MVDLTIWEEYEKNTVSWETVRREPAEYANIMVINGYFENGMFAEYGSKKWYWMMEGEEIFCKILRDIRTGKIREFLPVRLTRTKMIKGRTLAAEDCSII